MITNGSLQVLLKKSTTLSQLRKMEKLKEERYRHLVDRIEKGKIKTNRFRLQRESNYNESEVEVNIT